MMAGSNINWWSEGSDRLPEETWSDTRAAPRSFYSAPLCDDLDQLDAQVAFLGVPYDGGGAPGSRFGPDAIRDVRVYNYASFNGETVGGYYDIDSDRQRLAGVTMADCGNVWMIAGAPERNFWRVTRSVRGILSRGSLPVVIGGDHSITSSVVRAFDSYESLDMVHFDAHLDYNDHVQGYRWSSSAPIRRCSELPWVRNISQFGIRSITGGRGPVDDSRARGNRIVTADQFRDLGPEVAMDVVPESDATYLTIDVDVLDPTVCPGTGTPEPGGLTYLEMRAALRALARRVRIVGIDVVELSPPRDPLNISVKTVSFLLVDLLAAIFDEG